jgi:hypothetical protein
VIPSADAPPAPVLHRARTPSAGAARGHGGGPGAGGWTAGRRERAAARRRGWLAGGTGGWPVARWLACSAGEARRRGKGRQRGRLGKQRGRRSGAWPRGTTLQRQRELRPARW